MGEGGSRSTYQACQVWKLVVGVAAVGVELFTCGKNIAAETLSEITWKVGASWISLLSQAYSSTSVIS